jgi:hypothetical protein
MSKITHTIRSMFGRKSSPAVIHPEEWAGQANRPRVLIENPDGADLWAHADVLREAGYEVAMCGGPSPKTEDHKHTLCPLVAEGHCPLVEGADVVVSTTRLTDGREILRALSARSSPPLVVEGTSADLERDSDVIGDAQEVTLPIGPQQLVQAVERARSPRAAD